MAQKRQIIYNCFKINNKWIRGSKQFFSEAPLVLANQMAWVKRVRGRLAVVTDSQPGDLSYKWGLSKYSK